MPRKKETPLKILSYEKECTWQAYQNLDARYDFCLNKSTQDLENLFTGECCICHRRLMPDPPEFDTEINSLNRRNLTIEQLAQQLESRAPILDVVADLMSSDDYIFYSWLCLRCFRHYHRSFCDSDFLLEDLPTDLRRRIGFYDKNWWEFEKVVNCELSHEEEFYSPLIKERYSEAELDALIVKYRDRKYPVMVDITKL